MRRRKKRPLNWIRFQWNGWTRSLAKNIIYQLKRSTSFFSFGDWRCCCRWRWSWVDVSRGEVTCSDALLFDVRTRLGRRSFSFCSFLFISLDFIMCRTMTGPASASENYEVAKWPIAFDAMEKTKNINPLQISNNIFIIWPFCCDCFAPFIEWTMSEI